jgi:hypothetical protein
MLHIKRNQIDHMDVPIIDVLHKITLPPFQRNKNESHVEHLFQRLLNYYDVNHDIILIGSISIGIKESSSEWIVFDGQHRLHALSKLIAIRPIQDITIRVDVYHVDTEEQIVELYTAINTSEKVTLYRNINESKTAPAFEAWFLDRYSLYCKSTLNPKGLNVNLSEIMKRMAVCGVLRLSFSEIIRRIDELLIIYSQTTQETWFKWGVDNKRFGLVGNGAYPFYLGLYRHYEWIPRLMDEDMDIEHYTTAYLSSKRIHIPKRIRLSVWNKRWDGQMNGTCRCCKEPVTFSSFHVGHIIALSRGGDNSENNLDVICSTCNLDMGVMNMNEYESLFP